MGFFIVETSPIDTLKKIIVEYWESYLETTVPIVVITNDPEGDFMRADYNMGDYLILSPDGSESIKYRGNIQYYDKTHPLTIQIGTKEGYQKLRDMWKMIRAIFFDNKHSFDGWQLIRLISYTEMVNQDQMIWRAIVRLQVESAGICVETLV